MPQESKTEKPVIKSDESEDGDVLYLFDTGPSESITDIIDPRLLPDSDWQPEVLPNIPGKLNIVVDTERAQNVLSTLLDAYLNNQPPYNQDRVRLPHDPRHMPDTLARGSVEHAMFMFNICYYMRGGIKSNDAVRRMSKVFDSRPDLFDCEIAALTDTKEIEEVLKANGLGFQATVSEQWVENSKRMTERFDGDPRNIFSDKSTYDESLSAIRGSAKGGGFKGFQEKMTSMIIYYLMDEELIEPFMFPIPVDLHVMRVSIANELITFPDVPNGTNLYKPETLEALRALYFDFAERNNINPLRLCDAVWMLSESSCGRHPGNTTLEPLGRNARNGRSTYMIPGPVRLSDPTQQRAYESSCGQCPIEKTCEHNIPGTQYYVGGNIIKRGRRVRFPLPPVQDALF